MIYSSADQTMFNTYEEYMLACHPDKIRIHPKGIRGGWKTLSNSAITYPLIDCFVFLYLITAFWCLFRISPISKACCVVLSEIVCIVYQRVKYVG